jgi:hypothetical protein
MRATDANKRWLHGSFSEKSAYHLPRKFIRAYKHNEKSEFTAGHYGNGLRLLCMTTLHCIWSDDCNWASWATDLGRYSYFSGKLRHKFTRLSEKTIMLAKSTIRRISLWKRSRMR